MGNETDLQCIDLNWSNQLEMFKLAFGVDNLSIKYVDDEADEIGLISQQDYEYALELAKGKEGFLNLIFKDASGRTLSKNKFFVSPELKAEEKRSVEATTSVTEDSKASKHNNEWLENYLNKFKKDLLREMEIKIKDIVQQTPQQVVIEKRAENCQCNGSDLQAHDLEARNLPLDQTANKLLKLMAEARVISRPLKKAYLEEELQLSGAFNAEFVADVNMADGSKVPPNRKFQKQWLIKNTGQLAWDNNCDKFQVQLVCIGGDIGTLNEERVNVAATEVGATVQVSVNLVSASEPGDFYSEWAFVCRGFQFGPRLWCAIEVAEKELTEEDKQLATSQFLDSDDQDDEFVVLPDCLDLSKEWRPDLSKDLEASYLEIEQQIDQTLHEISANYETLDSQVTSYIQCDKPAEELFEKVKKASCSESFEEVRTPDPASSTASISVQVETAEPVVEARIESQIPTSSSDVPENTSSFDVIKNSLANLSGPTNIGDAKIELPSVKLSYTLPDDSTCSKYPIHSIPARLNQSVELITTAIGSLGSIYQTSSVFDQNMKALISMGFANRALNKKLMEKHSNDMDKVLADLLEKTDNNWHQNR